MTSEDVDEAIAEWFVNHPKAANTSKLRGHAYEQMVIDRLQMEGIPAMRGGNIKKHSDIVAWGCIFIEVKGSQGNSSGSYNFSFTSEQRLRGLLADILVFYLEDVGTFHVFDASNSLFYETDGEVQQLKSGVSYTPNRKPGGHKSILTPAIMLSHRDAWYLVEAHRLYVMEALKQTQKREIAWQQLVKSAGS